MAKCILILLQKHSDHSFYRWSLLPISQVWHFSSIWARPATRSHYANKSNIKWTNTPFNTRPSLTRKTHSPLTNNIQIPLLKTSDKNEYFPLGYIPNNLPAHDHFSGQTAAARRRIARRNELIFLFYYKKRCRYAPITVGLQPNQWSCKYFSTDVDFGLWPEKVLVFCAHFPQTYQHEKKKLLETKGRNKVALLFFFKCRWNGIILSTIKKQAKSRRRHYSKLYIKFNIACESITIGVFFV